MKLPWFNVALALLAFTKIKALKCRSTETSNKDQDMEWAVRQCVRQLTNNSSDKRKEQDGRQDEGQQSGILYSTLGDWEHPQRRTRDVGETNRQGGFREKSSTERGSRFRGEHQGGGRTPSWGVRHYSGGRPNENRNEDQGNGNDEFDFGVGPPDRKRQRPRDRIPPHSPNQQNQFDHDAAFNYNRRPMFQSNNKDPNMWEDTNSKLASIEPCMVHCIFQELKMLDEWGRLSKQAVMDRMTRRIRDREFKEFLQFTIEECFNEVERDSMPGRYGNDGTPETCKSAKTLAMCLEERGRQACDDWEEPMTNEEIENKKKYDKNGNNNREKAKEEKNGQKNPNRG